MTHLLANAGTPLLWFGMAYPILGSVTVAAIEVWLLKRFGVFDNGERKWNPILVGNLLSTVAGMLLLFLAGPLFGWLFGPKPLERVVPYSTAVWATAFVVTLVLEAPFYWLVARRKKLAALLGANVVTYAGLFVVTWFLSGTSLFRSVTVVDITAIKGSAEGWIYYVDGSAVRRIRLDGTRDEAATFHVDGKKSISIDTEDGVSANLVEYEPPKVLATNIGKAGQAALLPSQVLDSEVILDRVFRESFSYQPGRTFVRPKGKRSESLAFDTRNYYWAESGMSFRSLQPDSRFVVACGTPFLSWRWSASTVIPDGRVVAQFGPQVVVVDIPSRRVAWLANGRSPAVLLDQPAR